MKVFMSSLSRESETSSATALVVSASAMSALADTIISCVSFTLSVKSSSDTVVTSVVPVTASMLDVGPVEANDVCGMVIKGGGSMVDASVDELNHRKPDVVGSTDVTEPVSAVVVVAENVSGTEVAGLVGVAVVGSEDVLGTVSGAKVGSPSDVDPVCAAEVDSMGTVATAGTVGIVWAVVPGSIVVPPASLICTLSAWISTTRAFNSSTFAEIRLV